MRCELESAKEYMPHLVTAVNKLCDAVGDSTNKVEYSQDETQISDVLSDSVHSVKRIAKKLDMQRLVRVADADAAKDKKTDGDKFTLQLKQQIQINERLKSDLAEQKRVYTTQIQQLKAQLGDKVNGTETSVGKNKKLSLDLIKFRDQLMYFMDEFSENNDETTVKLLTNLCKETGRFMKDNGIEPLEESGTFTTECHVVSSTVNVDSPDLDNTIAKTFRAGYRIDGQLYRPQEVVLNVYKPE